MNGVEKLTDVVFIAKTERDAERFQELLNDFGYRTKDLGGGPGTHVFWTRLENLPEAVLDSVLRAPWADGCLLWRWDETEDRPEINVFETRTLTVIR